MNITKQRLQETVNRLVFEYEELSVRQLERLTSGQEFDFAKEHDQLDVIYYRYWGGVTAIRSLCEMYTPEYDFLNQVADRLLDMSDNFSGKLLELRHGKRQSQLEEPVFAPTTQATETVLIAYQSTVTDVTLDQDGEQNPSCSAVSLQSLGATDLGFVPDCPHCSSEYWLTMSAPDAAFCPHCGFSGLSGSELKYEAA